MDTELKRQKHRESQARWRAKNPTYQEEWRKNNPDYMKEFRNKNKEYIKQYNSEWSRNNLDKRAFSSSKYHAQKLKAIPKWLTEDDLFLISEVYSLAKLRSEITGFKWHVDHIIPLQGKLVCGLHVPYNLQVIPAIENYSKKNKFMISHERE